MAANGVQHRRHAGNAVALALQQATCTFTIAPTPTPKPTPTPTPVPTPAAVRNIRLSPGDGIIKVSWAPSRSTVEVTDYQARCRTGTGDWILSAEGTSLATTATVAGLTNGVPYECEVVALAPAPRVRSRRPRAGHAVRAAGGTGEARGHGARPRRPRTCPTADESISEFRFECSPDSGSTWPASVTTAATETTAEIGGLTNGVEYVCRSFASNASGTSDASPTSDAIRPCGSLLECNPTLQWILIGVGGALGLGILIAVLLLFRGRVRGYVVAVADVVHTANLGHGTASAST